MSLKWASEHLQRQRVVKGPQRVRPEREGLIRNRGEEVLAVGGATGQRQEACRGCRLADEARM